MVSFFGARIQGLIERSWEKDPGHNPSQLNERGLQTRTQFARVIACIHLFDRFCYFSVFVDHVGDA